MHYARRVRFGAGQHLLTVIREDNRQVTTRSLMALFSALLSLSLKPSETFEQFARRIDLLIQRLLNWRPPVVLPDQLLLFCALRALPSVPYGPVRHIILASPNITFFSGMNMLRDVANTGAKVINDTLGSGPKIEPSSVLCANPCPTRPSPEANHEHDREPRAPHHNRRARRTPAGRRPRTRKPRGPSKLCQKEGPCIHHGPHSFHATSECRDPTLSRTKKAQPRPPSSDPKLAGVADASPAAPDHVADGGEYYSNVMYSPVLLTQISKASRRHARTCFYPDPEHHEHLQHGRHNLRRARHSYHPRSISMHNLDSCIRTYSHPIHGESGPDVRCYHLQRHHHGICIRKNTPKSRKLHNRRRRRRIRNWRNRHILYPDGVLTPAHQRKPRKFYPGPKASARNRRWRRRQSQLPKNVERPLPASHVPSGSNLPLPLTISLLVSCSSCGHSVKLPWQQPRTHNSTWDSIPARPVISKPPHRPWAHRSKAFRKAKYRETKYRKNRNKTRHGPPAPSSSS